MSDGNRISILPEAPDSQMTNSALINVAVVDATSSTGFTSKKSPLSRLAAYILNKFTGLSLGGSSQTVKAAIDSLNSNLNNRLTGAVKSLSANTDTNITIPNNYRGSIAFIGYDVNCNGLLMVAASSGGTVTHKWIGDAPSNITLATGTRKLTVTSTQGVYLIFTNANQAIS